MTILAINVVSADLLPIAFLGLLAALVLLAVFRPDRVRDRGYYRGAWLCLVAALCLQALPPLFLRASGFAPPARTGSLDLPLPGGAALDDFFGAWRFQNVLGHVLVAGGLLFTAASAGLLGAARNGSAGEPAAAPDRGPQ